MKLLIHIAVELLVCVGLEVVIQKLQALPLMAHLKERQKQKFISMQAILQKEIWIITSMLGIIRLLRQIY